MNPFNKLYSRKSTTIPKVPLYLDIELTNHCNLKCKMCGTNYSKRKKGFMNARTLFNIRKYLEHNNIAVRLIGWGEPTLHKKYKKYIEYLKTYALIHINTNGYKPISGLGIINGITSAKFSWHGQKNWNFPEAWWNSISTTDLELKINKVNRFHRLEDGKVIEIPVKVNKTDTRWINGKNRSTKRFKRCGEVFDKLTILWNGDITVCCGDVEGKYVIGNINKDDLIDVWQNNKQLNYMRKELRKKNWNCTPLCKICYDYSL